MPVRTVASLNPDGVQILRSETWHLCFPGGDLSAVQSQTAKHGWRRSCPEVTEKVKRTETFHDGRRVAGGEPEAPNDRGQNWLSKPSTLSEPSGDVSSCWLTPCSRGHAGCSDRLSLARVIFGSRDLMWPRGQLNFISIDLQKDFFSFIVLTSNPFHQFKTKPVTFLKLLDLIQYIYIYIHLGCSCLCLLYLLHQLTALCLMHFCARWCIAQ